MLHDHLVPNSAKLDGVSYLQLEPILQIVVFVGHHVAYDQPQLLSGVGLLFFDVLYLVGMIHPVVVFLE